jgi:hypothetical protein
MRCVTGFAVRADTTKTPATPQPITMLAPPIPPTALGVPHVTIAIDTGGGCQNGAVTDATGRFHLLVPPGPSSGLTVCWKDYAPLSVPLPAGNRPLITDINFAVVVEGSQTEQEAR